MHIDKKKLTTFSSSSKMPCRVISFTSGKGGVGKTSVVVNIGIALAQLGRRVLILDADLGLANVDVMLGLKPKYNLSHVLSLERSLNDIMLSGPQGIRIIPASSGLEHMCSLRTNDRLMLMHAIEELAHDFDYLLIDTQAGIGSEVMYFNSASTEVVCIITAEPTSLTDAYALIKVLVQNYGEKSVSVLANNVPNDRESSKAYSKLERAVERFLQVDLNYLGFIPSDEAMCEAIMEQSALLESFPSSPSARAFFNLAQIVDTDFFRLRLKGGMQFFFRQILDLTSMEPG